VTANEERNPERVRLHAMLAVSEAEGTVADAAGPTPRDLATGARALPIVAITSSAAGTTWLPKTSWRATRDEYRTSLEMDIDRSDEPDRIAERCSR